MEDHCSTADFRAWNVKFERYLEFHKLDYIWKMNYDDRPINGDSSGNTTYDEVQWLECDQLIGLLLFEGIKKNKIADGYVA